MILIFQTVLILAGETDKNVVVTQYYQEYKNAPPLAPGDIGASRVSDRREETSFQEGVIRTKRTPLLKGTTYQGWGHQILSLSHLERRVGSDVSGEGEERRGHLVGAEV